MTDTPTPRSAGVRSATIGDADRIAQLLHDFNTEFDTPTPGPTVLAARLTRLLDDDAMLAVVAGDPAIAVALVTLRPSVWYAGRVAVLDELYVVPEFRDRGTGTAILEHLHAMTEPEMTADRHIDAIEINVDEADVDAQRFYERNGYSSIEPDTGERAFYYFRELRPAE